jgi:hypothetical protein
MSDDRSREQRHLAAEFMATAQLITDSNIRAYILALAQKWLDLAEGGSGQLEDLEQATCLRNIRIRIGQELRATYDLPPGLPDRMLALLMQLEGQQAGEHSGT